MTDYYFTPEELARLPKWARDKIDRLHRQIDDQKHDVAELVTALDLHATIFPGAVEIDPYGKMSSLETRGPRCFPDRTAVDFHLQKHGAFRVQMKEIGTLEINSTHGTLAIRPCASNLVTITTEKI